MYMHSCVVCHFACEFVDALQTHMQRHRKAELITAYLKQPSPELGMTVNNNNKSRRCKSESASHCNEINQLDRKNLRRSCRSKENPICFDSECSLSVTDDDNIDSYYIPNHAINVNCPLPKELDRRNGEISDANGERSVKRSKFLSCKDIKFQLLKKRPFDHHLSTPKVEKELTSDTDSCSGNAITSASLSDRNFCHYCGSGYRTKSMLADHIRHNHLNFCITCEVNIPDQRRYKEHTEKHLLKVYVCPYCDMEIKAKDIYSLHVERHLRTSVLQDVLSLEEDYFTEKTYMNTMYNMFNAGFIYAHPPGAMAANMPADFYQAFLQYSTTLFDVRPVQNFGYLCRTCGYTLFERSHYRDHLHYAHGVALSEVELFPHSM